MTEVYQRLLSLIEEGSLKIILPLAAVCFAMFILIVERTVFLCGSLTAAFWPGTRKRMRALEERVTDALDAYIESPGPASRGRLVDASSRLPTPYGRFFLRVLGSDAFSRSDLRGLHLAEAGLEGRLQIERGLPIISVLAKSAPLLGLFGTVTGMIQTFKAMMVASTSDPRALSTGISIALIATEVGLLVALPGVISISWLSRRAQDMEEEINLASLRLQQVDPERGVSA